MKLWLMGWMAAAAFGLAAEMPPVEKAIPAPVAALGEPLPFDFQGGIRMAVSAKTEKAQAHVLQGINPMKRGVPPASG